MIARILSSSTNFPAVKYSEKKVEQGNASFVQAYNFPIINGAGTTYDYESYLKKISSCASNHVKNFQFHATISAEGKGSTKEELQNIAEQWMQKMGYGEQPYLLYFHNDTGNNHVHIISSRIKSDGTRINPAFEGERAVSCINEIMLQNLEHKAQVDISAVIDDYKFSTVAQARLLFEQMGWKTSEKDGKVNLIKNGSVQGSIDLQIIKEKAASRVVDDKRKAQLSAIIRQYHQGLSLTELQTMLKKKFGIDIILHTAKGKTTPYGYTLIDNANKSVYKGSDIMPIKELFNPVNRDEKIKAAEALVNLHLNNEIGFVQFRSELYSSGYKLNGKGNISLKGEKLPLFTLDKDVLKQLRYNDRLAEANMYHWRTEREAKVLARLFYVKEKDLKRNDSINGKKAEDYKDMLHSVDGRLDIEQEAKERGYSLLEDGKGHTYIVDAEQHNIVDVSDFERTKDYSVELDDDRVKSFANIAETGTSFLAGVLELLANVESGEQERDLQNKQKKKKKNIGNR